MIDFRAAASAIAKATGLLLLAFVCAGVLWFGFSFTFFSDYRASVLAVLGIKAAVGMQSAQAQQQQAALTQDQQPRVADDFPKPGSQEYVELQQLQVKHMSIVEWILNCNGVLEPNNMPQDIKNMYLGYYFAAQTPPREGDGRGATRRPDNVHRSLIHLSHDIWSDRYTLYQQTKSAYLTLQIATFVTIGLGLLTTVLVSLSSTPFGQGATKGAITIRIFSIVFPALGTASAAVVAFYGPQAVWNQSNYALANLGQLHGQISSALWENQCTDDTRSKISDDLKDSIKRWRTRYIEIQAVPNPNTQAGGSSSGSSGDSSGIRTPTPTPKP
jgi:hypothetical protein